MPKLRSYSIETDNTVLLQFDEGGEQRVPVGQLRNFVRGEDLRTIQGALRIRRTFLQRHLPKFAIAIAAGGLISVTAMTHQNVINRLMQHSPQPNTIHHHPRLTTEAKLLPSPTPGAQSGSNVLGTAASPTPTASTPAPTPTVVPAPAVQVHVPLL